MATIILEEEFGRFDLNGDGYISVKEFRKTLSQSYGLEFSDKEYKRLMARVDKNGDGKIDYEESQRNITTGRRYGGIGRKIRKRFFDIAVDRAISFQEIFALLTLMNGVIKERISRWNEQNHN